ncbi:hypothetical protein HDU93_001955 [Gonapodya sp. JEL0774]|nr:hypothetical protein HDU93_001955 [Gonapodya sp. JEL0774]
MFILSVLRDLIRVPPNEFARPRNDAIIHQINEKFANKVLHNVGLCIRAFDLLQVGDAVVNMVSDGSYSVTTKFRLVVFRPFIGEVLLGRVHSQGDWGMRVSMGFFDDVLVPSTQFPQGSRYDHTTSMWIYIPPEVDADDPDNQYPFRIHDIVRFRVLAEKFDDGGQVVDTTSGPGAGGAVVAGVVGKDGEGHDVVKTYSITGTMDDPLGGLGNPTWFLPPDEEEADGMDE